MSSFAAGLVLASSIVAVAPLAAQVLRAVVPRGPVFFARWGFSHAFVVLASGFLVLVVLPTPPGVGEFLGGLYRTMAGLGTAAAVAALYARRLHPEGLAALGFTGGGNARAIVAGTLAYFVLLPAVLGMAFVWPVVAEWLELAVEPQAVLVGIEGLGGAQLAQAIVLAVVVGPLVEETVFRGFLQPLLVQNLHERGGIAATSFLFAALHGAAAFLPLFALSCLLGAIQLRSRRLAAAWFVHGLHNALTLAVVVGLPEWYESVSIETP